MPHSFVLLIRGAQSSRAVAMKALLYTVASSIAVVLFGHVIRTRLSRDRATRCGIPLDSVADRATPRPPRTKRRESSADAHRLTDATHRAIPIGISPSKRTGRGWVDCSLGMQAFGRC